MNKLAVNNANYRAITIWTLINSLPTVSNCCLENMLSHIKVWIVIYPVYSLRLHCNDGTVIAHGQLSYMNTPVLRIWIVWLLFSLSHSQWNWKPLLLDDFLQVPSNKRSKVYLKIQFWTGNSLWDCVLHQFHVVCEWQTKNVRVLIHINGAKNEKAQLLLAKDAGKLNIFSCCIALVAK